MYLLLAGLVGTTEHLMGDTGRKCNSFQFTTLGILVVIAIPDFRVVFGSRRLGC